MESHGRSDLTWTFVFWRIWAVWPALCRRQPLAKKPLAVVRRRGQRRRQVGVRVTHAPLGHVGARRAQASEQRRRPPWRRGPNTASTSRTGRPGALINARPAVLHRQCDVICPQATEAPVGAVFCREGGAQPRRLAIQRHRGRRRGRAACASGGASRPTGPARVAPSLATLVRCPGVRSVGAFHAGCARSHGWRRLLRAAQQPCSSAASFPAACALLCAPLRAAGDRCRATRRGVCVAAEAVCAARSGPLATFAVPRLASVAWALGCTLRYP